MEDGYSWEQKENPKLGCIMHRRIVDALTRLEEDELSEDGAEFVDKKRKAKEVAHQCDACGEMPCVWSLERDTIIAKDEMKHGHTCREQYLPAERWHTDPCSLRRRMATARKVLGSGFLNALRKAW